MASDAELGMSRYRPPTAPSTALITREGFERLRDELNFLWKEKRPEVVKALAAAWGGRGRSISTENYKIDSFKSLPKKR